MVGDSEEVSRWKNEVLCTAIVVKGVDGFCTRANTLSSYLDINLKIAKLLNSRGQLREAIATFLKKLRLEAIQCSEMDVRLERGAPSNDQSLGLTAPSAKMLKSVTR